MEILLPSALCQILHSYTSPHYRKHWVGARRGLGSLSLPLEGLDVVVPKPRVFSRIKLKSLERVCVDPNALWVKKLLQDLPKL